MGMEHFSLQKSRNWMLRLLIYSFSQLRKGNYNNRLTKTEKSEKRNCVKQTCLVWESLLLPLWGRRDQHVCVRLDDITLTPLRTHKSGVTLSSLKPTSLKESFYVVVYTLKPSLRILHCLISGLYGGKLQLHLLLYRPSAHKTPPLS